MPVIPSEAEGSLLQVTMEVGESKDLPTRSGHYATVTARDDGGFENGTPYMSRDDVRNDLFATFSANFAALSGIAHQAESLDDAVAEIREIVAGASPVWATSRLVETQPGVIEALRDAGYDIRIPTDPAEVRDQPVGLALARIGIAETGSMLLDEPDLADRSVSLMTKLLIAICPLDALKPSLDDAAPVLREIATTGPSYATFVTGPSRTADIERQLTIGVQGPAAMHVIFLP